MHHNKTGLKESINHNDKKKVIMYLDNLSERNAKSLYVYIYIYITAVKLLKSGGKSQNYNTKMVSMDILVSFQSTYHA